jgi:hypothetical protein
MIFICGDTNLARLKIFGGVFKGPLDMTITGLTAEGERVAAEAESFGILKNGVEYRNRYHFLFVFADNRIRQFREVDPIRPLMQAAGRG